MTTDMLRCALRGVAAYRPVVDEPVMRLALGVLDKLSAGDGSGAVEDYARLFYALRSAGSRSLGEWLDGRLRDRESPYAALAERGGEDPALEAAARRDIETFTLLAELDWDQVLAEVGGKAPREYGPVLANLPRWRGSSPFSFAELTEFYRANGAGLFARHRAFLWEDGALCPVEQPDCPGADEMLGYELQRNRVIANTRAMLEGNLVNNVLLYGDSGTGKSATVKNLLTLPGFEALRLIEVQKEGLADLPRLIRTLGGRRLKFILFIDDLAFGNHHSQQTNTGTENQTPHVLHFRSTESFYKTPPQYMPVQSDTQRQIRYKPPAYRILKHEPPRSPSALRRPRSERSHPGKRKRQESGQSLPG